MDFEWETYAFPPYKGMKPFDVLVFQYSLHVEEHGQLRHAGYIGEGDCRKEFIEHLLREIPKSGSILVYNMEGAEKLRLVQLAQQFPQYEKQLRAVWERMIDLSLPFSTGNVYDTRMAGYYSLKSWFLSFPIIIMRIWIFPMVWMRLKNGENTVVRMVKRNRSFIGSWSSIALWIPMPNILFIMLWRI